jgi:hypothetical protein
MSDNNLAEVSLISAATAEHSTEFISLRATASLSVTARFFHKNISTLLLNAPQNGARRNVYPAFWPVLYQPDRAAGSRYTVMNATGKPRMYHGTNALTMSGNLTRLIFNFDVPLLDFCFDFVPSSRHRATLD